MAVSEPLLPPDFDRLRWQALESSGMAPPWSVLPDQVRHCSAGRQWRGLAVWHQVGPAGDLYIPPQDRHCILLRRSTPTSLIHRRGADVDDGPWQPGDALIVPAGLPSFWRSAAARDNVHIGIDPVWLQRAAGGETLLRSNPRRQDPVLAAFAELLLAALQTPTSLQPAFAEHMALGIAVHLLEYHGERPPARAGTLTRRQIDTLAEAVAAELEQKWPLQRMSGLLGLSPFHFARSFKAEFGTTPHAWVCAQRMEAAARLLSGTRKTLAQVAAAIGYASAAHFAQAFRQHWGVTPAAYRRGR